MVLLNVTMSPWSLSREIFETRNTADLVGQISNLFLKVFKRATFSHVHTVFGQIIKHLKLSVYSTFNLPLSLLNNVA